MRSRLRRVRTPVLIGTGLVRILRSGLCRTAELVTSRELPLAQTVIGSLYSAGLLVGAGLGGVVTATWGTSATLLIDGASFVVSALLVAKIKRPFSSAMTTRRLRIRADTAELWRFLRTTPVASALMWLTAGLRLCYGMVGLLPLYALERFHVGDAGVGALYLAQGLGAVLGPFVGRRLTGGSTHRRLYVAAAALAIFGLGYLLLAHSTHLGPGMAAALVGHIGVGACAILALNGLQLTTPDHIRGRVMVFVFSLVRVTGGVDTCGRTHGRDHRDDRYHSPSWAFAVFYAIIWSIGSSRIRAERLDAPTRAHSRLDADLIGPKCQGSETTRGLA